MGVKSEERVVINKSIDNNNFKKEKKRSKNERGKFY